MLYLLESDTRNVKWNGIPLHEATSAVIKEQMNGDFILTVRYPITDSEIYQLFREDMLIKAPAPVIGPQLFRIKKPVENDDHLEITAYHITDDVMQRSINPLSINKQSCWQALSQLVQVAKSPINDFSFTSDITDRRTINTKEVETLYSVLMDGAHSIVGTWEGEMVRDNFAISIKRNRGEDRGVIISTHKNLKSYQRTKNSQNVVTRIHAKSTFKAEGAKEDTTIAITVDSPLIGAYPYINERSYINNNIQTVEELTKWASAKFTNEHIDKATDAIKIEAYELDGQTVHMGDTVNLKSYKHNVDVYKKAIAYEYDCLANNGQGAYLTITFDDKVKSGGNGGGVSAVANAILDKQETQFDIMLERAIANADHAFDAEFKKRKKEIDDGIELAKARAEEVKQELSDTINQRFNSFDNGPLQEVKRRAEEALRNAGASSLLAQEAKRIGLDSIAKLEAFKSQTTSAQTALSGDLDALKQTIANDIRPKQAQVAAEIAKQVEALVQTKKELAGVKSAQATYEETTTRRLAELTNLANSKASKSELVQTADELASKIASVQVGGRNYIRNGQFKNSSKNWLEYQSVNFGLNFNYQHSLANRNRPGAHFFHDSQNIANFFGLQQTFAFDGVRGEKVSVSLLVSKDGGDSKSGLKVALHYIKNKNIIGQEWQNIPSPQITSKYKRFTFTFTLSDDVENLNLMLYGEKGKIINLYVTDVQLERGSVATDYKEAPEDTDGQISAVESTFKQRADSLDAGVRSLTEGLRTKADISSLNVTAENIRQSVKRLETDTQNKLDQKLSQAEFEVQAGSIRQEILNATKDKADKTLVVAEAGKLREEFSKMKVGSRNYAEDYDFSRGLWHYSQGDNSPRDWTISNGEYNVKGTTNTWKQMQIFSKEGSRASEKNSTALLDLEIGETYTLSFQGICYSGSSSVWLSLRANRTASSYAEIMYGNFNLTSSWQTYQVTIPALTKPDNFDLWRIILGYNEIGHVAFRKVELTRSSTRIDAGPAPEDGKTDLVVAKSEFQKTAEGLRTDLSAIQEYVNKDGQRQEALQRYAREESAKQATAVRELVTKDYVGKATYQEDVKGINQRIEAVKTSANKEIASQIASYRQSVDGKFTDISSQITTYKQDVGGQISGLSNRLTSSEQGTTTQISNLSNRINSNKQGTDNLISNLKTQVATNKDNAERQMGRISDQVSANKANADSQFANVSNQLARKVETTDFQRVKETSQLYERILGNTENGIADKVARMAMTNQLFQVEVSKNENLKTVQRQLAGSWSVQNINSAGDIISGINLGATGHNRITGKLTHITGETLIDNAVIKSAMIDKLKTANFESGSVTTAILDAEAVTADKVRFDNAFIRKMITNEAFIDQLTSKRIFATKVESVVSSSTFLEAYQGRIGGFTIGRFDQGRGRWISGINQFSVGMGNGEGGSYNGENTAFWANWGYSWNYPGPNAWYVTTSGNMYCRNGADFHGKVDFSNRSTVNFYSQPSFSNGAVINGNLQVTGRITYSGGEWLYSPRYKQLRKSTEQGSDWLYLDIQGNYGSDWIHMNKVISDRRYKSNIQDSQVSGLDVIEKLKTYSYRKEYDGKIEDISCGIMAQDVQKYAPEAFYKNPDGAYTYETFALVPYLIKAIQELNQKIEKMEKTIA